MSGLRTNSVRDIAYSGAERAAAVQQRTTRHERLHRDAVDVINKCGLDGQGEPVSAPGTG